MDNIETGTIDIGEAQVFTTTEVTTPSVEQIGNEKLFIILSSLIDRDKGYSETVKAMEIPGIGCLVNTSTRGINPDGSYAVTESSSFVPEVKLTKDANNGYKLVDMHTRIKK